MLARLTRVVLFLALSLQGGQAALAAGEIEAARDLANAGRFAEALDELDALPAAEADEPQARFLRGVLLAELGRSADAIEVFEGLTQDYPRLAEPFNNLAVLHAAEGRYEEARDALLVAIENNPSYATAHENLGDIYAKMAGLSYTRAAELDAGNASARDKSLRVASLFDETVPPPARTAAAPVPAPAPAPAPVAPPAAMTDDAGADRDEAIAMVRSWASAWSAQDADRYLAHYGSAFVPADGVSRPRWEEVRRIRLARPSFIVVTVSDLDVEVGPGAVARATFDQSYRSDTYEDAVRKQLDLARTPEGWKIVGERTLP